MTPPKQHAPLVLASSHVPAVAVDAVIDAESARWLCGYLSWLATLLGEEQASSTPDLEMCRHYKSETRKYRAMLGMDATEDAA